MGRCGDGKGDGDEKGVGMGISAGELWLCHG